jgi:HD-like signal output (HDOD) protein
MANEKYDDLRQLPPFPAITTKLLRALAHDDSETNEIVNLIRADAALASQLLQVVNSAMYATREPVTSIQSAVVRLGFQAVRNFALTVSMKGFLHTTLRFDLLRGIWRHSLACGIVCDELAAACSTNAYSRDDNAYTAGLLHDVGRLGLFVTYPERYAELLERAQGAGMMELERQAFGMDHCEAGAWLAQTWGLPEEVQRAASGHHQPPNAGEFGLLNLVRLGVLLAEALGFDVTPPAHAFTLPEIRAMLPPAAQYRFDPEPVSLKTAISAQMDAFD